MKNGAKPITPIKDLNEFPSGLLGLTKREYFAGLAMQKVIKLEYSDSSIKDKFKRLIRVFGFKTVVKNNRIMDIQSDCSAAIMYADELLKQLEK